MFDPLSVGVDPVEASTEVLLALQAAHRQGHKSGHAAGMQRGFIEGKEFGVSQGLIRAKEIIEKEAHRG